MFTLAFCVVGHADLEDLPEDRPFVATVVHGVKYPLEGRLGVDVSLVKYYGDRLRSTWGYGVMPSYNMSEKLWFGLPVHMLSSSAVDTRGLDRTKVAAVDPKMTAGPTVGYNPVYGKFVLNNHIYHFRAGINGGAVALFIDDENVESFILGLQGGVQLQIQFSEHWKVQMHSNVLAYSLKGSGNFDSQNRIDWLYGLSAGRTF